MQRQLPVRDIFLAALKLPLQHYRKLTLLGIPVLIMGAINTALLPAKFNFDGTWFEIFTPIILMILMGVTLLIAIVGCHRTFLMKEDEANENTSLYWSGNEIGYLGCWIRIMLYLILIMIPFMFIFVPLVTVFGTENFGDSYITIIVMSLINIPFYYLISRWSLMLPAVATDNRRGPSWSWKLSKGNAWRLTLLVGLFPFIKDLVFALIPVTDSLAFNLIDGFLWLVVGIVEVGLLSLSYEFLMNNRVPDSEIDLEISLDDSETA